MGFTAEELNTRPYAINTFSTGIQAADYAALHADHGEEFRLWRSLDQTGVNRSGKTYEEVTLGGSGKGFFYRAQRDLDIGDDRVIPIGTTQFSCLASVAEVTAGCKILRSHPKQARWANATVIRGTGAVDALPQRFVTQILRVMVNGLAVAASHYEAVSADSPDDDDTGGLRWLSGAPLAGTRYQVLYRYQPFFVCSGESLQSEPVGSDGELLPQRVLLNEER